MARAGNFNLVFLLVEAKSVTGRSMWAGFNFIVRKRINALFAELDWNMQFGAEPCVP